MKYLPFVFWGFAIIFFVILKNDGVPIYIALAIIGTSIDIVLKKNRMKQTNDYSTSQRFTLNRLYGILVACIIILAIYFIKIFY